MYGVPADLDLAFLHGAELIQVCLGQYQLQFATGQRIDGRHDGPDRPPYQLHRLLGSHVVGSDVSAPESCALRFEGGEVLRLFDDSPQYESFQIGDIIV